MCCTVVLRGAAWLTVYCPELQWRHQLDLFSNALQTGQLDVRAFGLEFQVCPDLQHGVAHWYLGTLVNLSCVMHRCKNVGKLTATCTGEPKLAVFTTLFAMA